MRWSPPTFTWRRSVIPKTIFRRSRSSVGRISGVEAGASHAFDQDRYEVTDRAAGELFVVVVHGVADDLNRYVEKSWKVAGIPRRLPGSRRRVSSNDGGTPQLGVANGVCCKGAFAAGRG